MYVYVYIYMRVFVCGVSFVIFSTCCSKKITYRSMSVIYLYSLYHSKHQNPPNSNEDHKEKELKRFFV